MARQDQLRTEIRANLFSSSRPDAMRYFAGATLEVPLFRILNERRLDLSIVGEYPGSSGTPYCSVLFNN